jgi:hypothetical protein
MDYSKNPQGGKMNGSLSNEHPNAHDYEQLELIYAHLDPGGGTGKKCNGKGNPDCQSAPQIEEHGDGTTTVTWILPAKETS